MIRFIRDHRNMAVSLALSFAFSLGLILFRVLTWHKVSFVFLSWNLFLAFIPLLAALFVYRQSEGGSRWVMIPALLFWLLFFPNAPYIVTDLFHLKLRDPVPYWYDLLLLMSFSWNGLACCFVSLALVHAALQRAWGKKVAVSLVSLSLLLSGFGVYLGRFLRWNSWDILSHPQALLADISERFWHPFQHGKTWFFTLCFSLFLGLVYSLIKAFSSSHQRLQP